LASYNNDDDAILASLWLLQHAKCQITMTHQDLPHQFPASSRDFSNFCICTSKRVQLSARPGPPGGRTRAGYSLLIQPLSPLVRALLDDNYTILLVNILKLLKSLGLTISNDFFQTGKHPAGWMYISHDVEPGLTEIEEGIQFSVTHEVIQEKDKTNIGFLVGPMRDVANLEDMREAHGNYSILKCIKMVLSNKPF
jgi:hypothetical protein